MAATPVLILGSHIFAEEVADLLADLPEFDLIGFVENWDRERCKLRLRDRPVYWVDDLPGLDKSARLLNGIGTTKRRAYVEQVEPFGLEFATCIHPTAHLARSVTVGSGSIVGVHCAVAAETRIGRHVVVNRGCLIGHHTVIGDYVTISPGANIAGVCTIGDGCYISMGSIILDRMTVGSGSVVAAGSVVTKPVPPNVLVAGSPARVVKQDVDGR